MLSLSKQAVLKSFVFERLVLSLSKQAVLKSFVLERLVLSLSKQAVFRLKVLKSRSLEVLTLVRSNIQQKINMLLHMITDYYHFCASIMSSL